MARLLTWLRARSLVVAFLASILRLMSGRRQVRRSGRSTDPWLVSTCRVRQGCNEHAVF